MITYQHSKVLAPIKTSDEVNDNKYANIINICTARESYLPTYNKQDKIVVDYLWYDFLKDEDESVKSLVGVLDKTTELNLKTNEGYAPYPYKTIAKYKYVEAMKRVEELNIVDRKECIKPYGNLPGLSREYRLKLDIYFKLRSLSVARVDTYSKRGFALYNLISGKKITKVKNERHHIYKPNKAKKS